MNPLANSQKINRSPPHLHLNLRADSDPRRVSFNPTEEESESYSASLLLGSQGYDIKSRKAASITGFGDHFLCQAGYNSEEAASPLNDQTQKERDCLTFEKMVSHVESVLDEDLDKSPCLSEDHSPTFGAPGRLKGKRRKSRLLMGEL